MRTGDPEATPHNDAPIRNTIVRPASDRIEPDFAPSMAQISPAVSARTAGRAETGSPDAYLHGRPPSAVDDSGLAGPGHPPTSEMQVLRAGLEDCLCHLVELYGVDFLDSFLERRLRRNISPILAHAEEMDTEGQRSRLRRHARAAEQLLREIVESVRKDPTPPESD